MKLELIVVRSEKERRLCEASLYNFIRCSWHILEPNTPFVNNWHYRELCAEVQRSVQLAIDRKPRDHGRHLITNLPPRTYKSSIISVCLPSWVWTKHPGIRFLTASATSRLSDDFAWRTRGLINSAWYQDRWGHVYKLSGDQNVKSYYITSERGYRYATSVGGQCTGFGGDIIIIDDPIELEDAMSEQSTEHCYKWYTGVIENRLNSPTSSLVIINHQRFTTNDLTGKLRAAQPDRFKVFCLPAEASPEVSPPEMAEHYTDGIMFPQRLGADVLKDRKITMGSWQFESQYNQNPQSVEAGLFKKWWWRFWVPMGTTLPSVIVEMSDGTVKTCHQVTLPKKFDATIGSWDMAFKGKADSDRVAGGIASSTANGDKYLRDLSYGTMGFLDTIAAVVKQYEDWKDKALSVILIEDAANGPAVLETLEAKVPVMVRVKAIGSKAARAVDGSRAMSVLAQAEAGHIYLPHPAIAPWVKILIDEFAAFPHGKHDDMVDMLVYAVRRLSGEIPPLFVTTAERLERERLKREKEREEEEQAREAA